MKRPSARDRRPLPVPSEERPWALRREIEVPDVARCATCRRDDVSFLVLDNRDLKWRCAACSRPGVGLPMEALQPAPAPGTARSATPGSPR